MRLGSPSMALAGSAFGAVGNADRHRQAAPRCRATGGARVVDVVSGVLRRGDGRVLLSRRPQDKLSPGHWDLPGGKIEAGERAEQALARELREEVGIEVVGALPWMTREHSYPDKVVRSQFFRVTAWRGSPHGRESQRVSWEQPQDTAVAPLLPAHATAIAALGLPAMCAFSDAGRAGVSAFLQHLESGLRSGLRLVVVREPWMAPGQLAQFARRVMSAARAHGARVLVDADESLVRKIDCDGMHSGSHLLRRISHRPPLPLWAASCGSRADLLRAAGLGADFVVLRAPASDYSESPSDWKTPGDWVRNCTAAVFVLADLGAPSAAATGLGGYGIGASAVAWR